MTDDSLSRDIFNTPSFPAISDYDGLKQTTDGRNSHHKPNSMKHLLCKPVKPNSMKDLPCKPVK